MVAFINTNRTTKLTDRLTLQTVEIASETAAIRCLDWDRDRFDIEFGLQNGTTYNSFIIQGEKLALVDTSHAKFRQLYLELLEGLIDPAQLDYQIISQTEPDHSGLVKDVLKLAPQVTVVGAKVAIKFLADMVHQPFEHIIVKNGARLDLGNGHELEFVSAPNLHWPDTIFTYDNKTQILYKGDTTFTGAVERVWEDGFRLNTGDRVLTVDSWDVYGDNTPKNVTVGDRLIVTGEFSGREFDAFSITDN